MHSQSVRVAIAIGALLLFAGSAAADSVNIGSFSFTASGPGSVSIGNPPTTFSVSQSGGYTFIQAPSINVPACYVTTVTVNSAFLFSQQSCSGIGGGTGTSLSAGNHTTSATIVITLANTTWTLSDGSIFIADSNTYTFTFGLGTHSLDITGQIVSPVPEPASIALVATGLVAMVLRRRRKEFLTRV